MSKARSLSPSTSPCATPPAESQILAGLTIHIVNAKLDPIEIGEMFALARNAGAKLSSSPQNASVLITSLTMRRRLERHISWDVASTKHIVSPQWLRSCIERDQLLPFSQFETIKAERRASRPSTGSVSNFSTYSPAASPWKPKPNQESTLESESKPNSKPKHKKGKALVSAGYTHPLATHRRSPLVCPNQKLCEELALIMKSRHLGGDSRSELAYARAIAVIKSYPKVISDADETLELPGIGPKIASLIKEFLETGSIGRAQEDASSERFKVLSELTTIHGIGAQKAREHYDARCRSIEDMAKIYQSKEKGPQVESILTALELRKELAVRMPRDEVQTIAEKIFDELNKIQAGCEYEVCGSYRRGKPDHSDIDFVFTHSLPGAERHLCTRLVERLKEAGLITHVLNVMSYSSKHENVQRWPSRSRVGMDLLDKALVIVKMPGLVHRRVDLICAPHNVYWTAVIGWTGSKQFGRDLRIHAKQQGLKFDSGGIIREADSQLVVGNSEQEVFEALGLEYVEPEMRNADLY